MSTLIMNLKIPLDMVAKEHRMVKGPIGSADRTSWTRTHDSTDDHTNSQEVFTLLS